jgi:uncharacterized protein (TIGR02271 family)
MQDLDRSEQRPSQVRRRTIDYATTGRDAAPGARTAADEPVARDPLDRSTMPPSRPVSDEAFDADARTLRAPPPSSSPTERRLERGEATIELHEEQLVAEKDLRDVGEIVVRTEVNDVPARMEVEAIREEVEIEHVPVGTFVRERRPSWEEGDVLVIPIYEEQLVVSKRLVLREQIYVRRVASAERHLVEQTVQRERLVVEDPQGTGLVHVQYPEPATQVDEHDQLATDGRDGRQESGFFEGLVRKALR